MKKKLLMLGCVLATAALGVACNETPHEHTFADAWTSDATNHWHVATCEHTTETAGKAAHVDTDKDGDCDVCGYELGTKAYVKAAVDLAVSKASTINGGKVVMDADADYDPASYFAFELGQDGMKLTTTTTRFDDDRTSETEETVVYYSAFNGGSFGAYEVVTGTGAEAQTTYGRIPADSVPASMATALTLDAEALYLAEGELAGTEAVLSALWAIADANALGTSVYSVEDGVYSFNADYLDVDGVWYLVANVEFKLAAAGNLAWAKVEINNYNVETDTLARENATDPVVLSPYAVPGSNVYFVIEQTAGDKVADLVPTAATADAMLLTDFAIAYVDTTTFGGGVPEMGFVTDAPLATVVGKQQFAFAFAENDQVNLEEDEPLDMSNEELTFDVGDADIEVYEQYGAYYVVVNEPTEAGQTFAVTVSTEKVTKTIYFTATRPAIENIFAKVDGEAVMETEIDAYTEQDYVFSAGVYPAAAESAYTLTLTETEGATVTDNQDGTYTFNATEVGTYNLTFTSVADNTVVRTLVVNVLEKLTADKVIDKSKTYTVEYSSTFLTFSYGDGVDAWKQGTATVTGLEYYPIPYAPPAYATVVFNYTYDETAGFVATIDTANSTAAYLAPMTEDYWEGGTLTTTKEISLTMSADMKLVLAMNTIYDYDAEAEAHDVQDYEWSDESEMIVASATDVLAAKCGMSTYEANSGYFLLNGEEVVANINFWSDGSGTLKVANGNPGELFSINFSFELVEGQDGYTVNFSNASLDAWGYDFAANDLVTEDAGVYTIAATTISADMSTITIGTTVLSLIS